MSRHPFDPNTSLQLAPRFFARPNTGASLQLQFTPAPSAPVWFSAPSLSATTSASESASATGSTSRPFPSVQQQMVLQLIQSTRNRPPVPPSKDYVAIGEAVVIAYEKFKYHSSYYAAWQRINELLNRLLNDHSRSGSFVTTMLCHPSFDTGVDINYLYDRINTIVHNTQDDLCIPTNWESLIGVSFEGIEADDCKLSSWLGFLAFLSLCAELPATPELVNAWNSIDDNEPATNDNFWYALQQHIDAQTSN